MATHHHNDYWRNKTALITGGSAGFGLRLATMLVGQGARVAIAGRSAQRLEVAAERLKGLGGEVVTFSADVSKPGETKKLVDQTLQSFGQLDFVTCAAGKSARSKVLETPREEFEELMAINFFAAVDMAQAAAPHLAATGGHLVLIGSLATHVAPRFLGAYPASKHPLAALAQQLRLEAGETGLHTLLVCPGPIERDDAGTRYQEGSRNLPATAHQPGGGAKVSTIDPDELAGKLLDACVKRKSELVVPAKARLLFALTRLSPPWGDWLLRKKSG